MVRLPGKEEEEEGSVDQRDGIKSLRCKFVAKGKEGTRVERLHLTRSQLNNQMRPNSPFASYLGAFIAV